MAELRDFHISTKFMLLMYLALAVLLFPLRSRHFFKLPLIIITTLALLLPFNTAKTSELIVYALRSGILVEYTTGEGSCFVFQTNRNSFLTEVFRIMKNRKQNHNQTILPLSNIYSHEGLSLLFWDEGLNEHPPDSVCNTTATILTARGRIRLDNLIHSTKSKIYIIPACFSEKKSAFLSKYLIEKGRFTFNCRSKGAFTFKNTPAI
jgi:hypothetical protein